MRIIAQGFVLASSATALTERPRSGFVDKLERIRSTNLPKVIELVDAGLEYAKLLWAPTRFPELKEFIDVMSNLSDKAKRVEKGSKPVLSDKDFNDLDNLMREISSKSFVETTSLHPNLNIILLFIHTKNHCCE